VYVVVDCYNLVARREKRIKTSDEICVAPKERRDTLDHRRGVDAQTLEFPHNIKESVINDRLIIEL